MTGSAHIEELVHTIEAAYGVGTTSSTCREILEAVLTGQTSDVNYVYGRSYVAFVNEFCTLLTQYHLEPESLLSALIYPLLSSSHTTVKDVTRLISDNVTPSNFAQDCQLWVPELCRQLVSFSELEWDVLSISLYPAQKATRQAVLRSAYLYAIGASGGADSGRLNGQNAHRETLIRMLLSCCDDLRTVVVKVLERIYLTKLLNSQLQAEKHERNESNGDTRLLFADVNLQIYAQVADRLGLWSLKSDLEDSSFKLADPDRFRQIAHDLASRKQSREQLVSRVAASMSNYLSELDIKAEVSGRAKHIYSIYKKMVAKGVTLPEINDLIGFRVIVDTVDECYKVFSALCRKWTPLEKFYGGHAERDWIVSPKENGYQSIHTTLEIDGQAMEVQIRTREMHNIAEFGTAAMHWVYKRERAYRDRKGELVIRPKEIAWRDALAQTLRDSPVTSPLADTRIDARITQRSALKRWIYVFTPVGDIVQLEEGATPLDFAYRIHTEKGHQYSGAKVGDHLVRTEYQLKTGDLVTLLPSRGRTAPNPEWLAVSRDSSGNRFFPFAHAADTRRKVRQGLREAGLRPASWTQRTNTN